MSLTDTTYFIRDCNLPATVLNNISASLTRYELEILERTLGYPLAKLVAAYANPGSDQRIIDIVEGKEYLYGTQTVNWNGLVNAEKVSILTYYTFIEVMKDKSISFQSVGATASTLENGVNVGISGLVQRASANLMDLIGYYGQDVYAPSLYNFLRAHESDYSELIFNRWQPVNALGI